MSEITMNTCLHPGQFDTVILADSNNPRSCRIEMKTIRYAQQRLPTTIILQRPLEVGVFID